MKTILTKLSKIIVNNIFLANCKQYDAKESMNLLCKQINRFHSLKFARTNIFFIKLFAMDTINIGKRWVVTKIMNYMQKYFTALSFENIQVEMLKGGYSFDELDFNVKVLEQEFKLPFNIISGRIHNLKIEIPWYKLLSNVAIQIETIEFEIKMKENEKYQNDEMNNTNKKNGLESTIEDSLSSKELYIKKLVNTILENLSISCKNVTLKLVEDDIVIKLDIKLLELNPCDYDWRPNNFKKKSSMQWVLKKMGKVLGITVSMNKINKHGSTEYYFVPMVLNMSLSIRFCCILDINCTVQPSFIQLDIFSPKIIITLMEPHMLMITELLNLFKKYKSANTKENNDDIQRNVSTSSTSKLAEESWKDLVNKWTFGTNNQILTFCQVLKIGIYIEELKLLLNLDVTKSINEYRPLVNTTCVGCNLEIVQRTHDKLNVQFGISKIIIKPEEDCICGFQDCFNNQKSYFSSGKIQEDYLSKSLFQKHISLNDENEFYFLYGTFEGKSSLKTTPSLAFNYNIYQKPTEKHEISLEAGACVINITLGLLHRFQFILKLLLDHYSSLFNTKSNYEEIQTDSLDQSSTQNVSFDFDISNILIKIFPICHAPSRYYKNKLYSSIIDDFPEALIGIHNFRGRITIDESTTCDNTEGRKQRKLNLMANKLEANVYKSNATHSLLVINKIEWNKLESYCIENKSDSSLNIGNVKFKSSKDNYLLFYYIVYSIITQNQCDQMYTNNCFINSELLQNNLDLVVFYWEIKDINIRCVSQNQSFNFDITLNKMSANTIKLNKTNQFWSKIMTSPANELEGIIHPMLHIIVQIPSENNVTQMPLLFLKTEENAINIDPLIFEWLVYVPEYRETPIDLLERTDNRIANDFSFNSPVDDQLENEPKIFHWFEKLKSTPVFVEISAITLYIPCDVISIAEISFIDEKINIKKWIEILSDHDIDVLVMSISRFTINCEVEMQQAENYFDGFPIHFPESLWSNDQSLFPWKINIKQLECYIFNKKYVQSTVQDDMKVFDTFDVLCSVGMTRTIKMFNDKNSTHFECFLDFHILELVNIYISEQQVKVVGAFLCNITDVLRVYSHTSECKMKTDGIKMNTNTENENSKNNIKKRSLNVETSDAFIKKNNLKNQFSVKIDFLLNDITLIFSKNQEVNQFEPSVIICLYQPTMFFLSTENSKSYQIVIYHTIMYTTSYEKVIKPDELPKEKDSVVFFETNNAADSEEEMNFMTIELSGSHKNDHPEIQIDIERNVCFSIYKVTINTLLEVMNIFNQKHTTGKTIFKNNSTDEHVNNSDSSASIFKSNWLEFSESNKDDIFNQDMNSRVHWTACIKSQKLSLKLFTETKNKLILDVKNSIWQFHCVRKVQTEQIKQTDGEIMFNDATLYLERFDSNDLILHPTQIIIGLEIRSLTPNARPLQKTSAKLNMDYVTFDVSQNRCKTLLVFWNTYKYLFETKKNIPLTNDGQNFISIIQMSMSILIAKINFLQDVKNISSGRYHCVSEDLINYKLLIVQLDKIQIGLNYYNEEITALAKSFVDLKLLLYEHLNEISIVKFLIDLTNTYTTNHKIRNNQCSIQTDDIQCQIGPSIVTSLTAAMELWFRPSTDSVPYTICNDTCFTIILRQTNTDENIVLNGLECYNYSWLISTENPCLQLAIKNEDHMSHWSEEITLKGQSKKYLTIEDSNGKDTILILSVQQTSAMCIKIVITSTLKLMNKTECFIDARIITDKRNNYDQQDRTHTLIVSPYEVTPSLMLEPDSAFSVALRFSNVNSQWSNIVNVNNITKTKENTKCVLIKIPKKVNLIKTFDDVLCHFVFEEIDGIPQLLILLLPPFVICSYLPNDTTLNVSVVKSNRKTSINGIKVKSAIEQKNIQKIDLPVLTADNDDDVDIILSLSEDEYMSSIVSVEGHIQLENETHTNMIHGIGDHLDNPYALEKTNLKWPFVGNRFDRVQWKSGIAQHKIKTIQTIQNYGVFGGLGTLTRLITIQPWALVVNTTGQSISLHSWTSVLCTIENMSVAVPTLADNDDRTFHIEINVEDDVRYRSSAINFFDEQHLPNQDYHRNSTPADGQSIVFANSPHSIAYLITTSSVYNNTKIVHLQSLYVATNCSSIDLDVLLVCSMPTANLLDVPVHSDGLFVDLPRTSSSLGKPLALWTLMGSTTVRIAELNRYLIIAWSGYASCPVALRDVRMSEKDEHPVPVVFSSVGPEVCSQLPLICMTLKKHKDGQHIITIREQPYPPQLVFHNRSPQPLVVTDCFEFAEGPTIRLISSDWCWPYEIMPGETSYLSFPFTTLANGAVVMYLFVANEKTHSAGHMIVEPFASIMVDNNDCTTLLAPESDREIEIRISRRAFTYDVVLYPTNVQYDTPINRNLFVDHRATESRFYVNCYIQAIELTALIDEFHLKKILTVVINSIETTIQPIKNNINRDEDIKLVFSINNIAIYNEMFYDDNFEFPVILFIKPRGSIDALPRNQNIMKYLLQEIRQLKNMDSAITIMFIVDKSSYSTPVILDIEVALSMMEVFVEDKYFNHLLEYPKTYNLKQFAYEVQNDVLEGLIPINVIPLPAIKTFRILRISPFTLVFNLQWSKVFDISMNHLRFKFVEFKKRNMHASLNQIGQCASIHYYDSVINNAGSAMSSLKLLGAPSNFICMAKKGFQDLVSMPKEGFVRGPKGFVLGLANGIKSLTKHLSLGTLLTVLNLSKSWSRTLNNFRSLPFIRTKIVSVLKMMEIASTFFVEKLL